jgi:hypothetical protein
MRNLEPMILTIANSTSRIVAMTTTLMTPREIPHRQILTIEVHSLAMTTRRPELRLGKVSAMTATTHRLKP